MRAAADDRARSDRSTFVKLGGGRRSRLLGGRNEGLLGITYKIVGPLAQPTMTFNPMSAIAPGIFRKIFEYQ